MPDTNNEPQTKRPPVREFAPKPAGEISDAALLEARAALAKYEKLPPAEMARRRRELGIE